MAQGHISIKKQLINQTNSRIIAVTAAASFVVVFCLVASVSLISQLMYQNRVIAAKKTALKQIRANIEAREDLTAAYKSFVGQPTNIIKGNSFGSGTRDGDNGKIVLDALPSKYDFPALTTSLEAILIAQGVRIQSITGTDDEVAQAPNQSTPNPEPVAIPFETTTIGDYQSTQKVLQAYEASIRPIQVQSVKLTVSQDGLTLNTVAQTYYQPEKNLNVTTKVVK